MEETIYLMVDVDNKISNWILKSYKFQLSYKNPDEYSRRILKIKEEKIFYEIKFILENENKTSFIDFEINLHKHYFRLNNHWSCDINSLRFTKEKDFDDFNKKIDELNVEVKKVFDDYYKNDSELYFNDYLYCIKEDFKKLVFKYPYNILTQKDIDFCNKF